MNKIMKMVKTLIFQFKATLKHTDKPVWRTFELNENTSFKELHIIMQHLFNWSNSHLYGFFIHRTNGNPIEKIEISPSDPEEMGANFFKKYTDERETIGKWFIKKADKATYIYDFNERWEHEIELVNMYPEEQNTLLPRCIDAENIAPDENQQLESRKEINLTKHNHKILVNEINHRFQRNTLGDHLKTIDHDFTDYWPRTMALSSDLQDEKPWTLMNEEHIFAMAHPDVDELLYCAVLGQRKEVYGLVVYTGIEGLFTLMNILKSGEAPETLCEEQSTLLLTFEDKEDLMHRDLSLLEDYEVSFKGKKSWPTFVSIKHASSPWEMSNEEARILSIAISETLAVFKEIKEGLEVPYIPVAKKILLRSPKQDTNELIMENKVISIDDPVLHGPEEPLTIPEIQLKRATRLKVKTRIAMEFVLTNLKFPVQKKKMTSQYCRFLWLQ